MSTPADLLALLEAPAPAHVPGQLALLEDDRPAQLALDLDTDSPLDLRS